MLQFKGQKLDCCSNAPQFPVLSDSESQKGSKMWRPRSAGANETKGFTPVCWLPFVSGQMIFVNLQAFVLFLQSQCVSTVEIFLGNSMQSYTQSLENGMYCSFNSLISSCQDEPLFTAIVNKNLTLPLFFIPFYTKSTAKKATLTCIYFRI